MAAEAKPEGIPKILSCSLFAHEAGDFEVVHRAEERDAGVQRFVVLGRFDLLVLQVSDKMPDDQRLRVTNARVASSCTYLARVIDEPGFDPQKWSQTHPLLGFCSLRLARQALKEAGSFDFVRTYLQEKLGSRESLRWVVASGTGWEDIIVLFFGQDFNEIMRAIGVLRSMDKKALPSASHLHEQDAGGMNHLILTSCTQPAIALDGWTDSWSSRDTQTFLSRLNADEPLNWSIRVETYPGHWGGFVKALEDKAREVGIPVKLAPLFGQADLRITPDPALKEGQEISPKESRHATHGGLLTFLMEVMYKLEKGSTAIRTVETRLIPVREGYKEDVDADYKTTRTYEEVSRSMLTDFKQHSTKVLAALGTPPHSLAALEETLNRIQGMAGDRLHGEEFGAIWALADSFVRRANPKALNPEDKPSDLETLARDIQHDISDWQMKVERCLADRFRGPYPAGDSLMVRLGSHAGAHLRFLVVMDHFAQLLYDTARGHMDRRLQGSDKTRPPFRTAALATFIGNSPSAYATSHLIRHFSCGFTDVPAHMVGRLQYSHVVAHETGHHFYRAFLCCEDADSALKGALKIIRKEEKVAGRPRPSKDNLSRDVREILADLFASHTCFPKAARFHQTAASETIRAHYKGPNDESADAETKAEKDRFVVSVLVEVTLRMLAIQALIEAPQGELNRYDSLVERYVKDLGLTGIDDPRLEERYPRVKERINYTRLALKVIIHLRANSHEFQTFLSALADCAEGPGASAEDIDSVFLRTFREFMTKLSATPGESLAVLDQLWFMVLRSPSQSWPQLS